MQIWMICFVTGVLLLLVWLVFKFYNDKKKLGKRLLLNMVGAVAVLTVLNALSGVTGYALPVNLLSMGTAAVLGAPGMLGLLAVKFFL